MDKSFWFSELFNSSYDISFPTHTSPGGLMHGDVSLTASAILVPTGELSELTFCESTSSRQGKLVQELKRLTVRPRTTPDNPLHREKLCCYRRRSKRSQAEWSYETLALQAQVGQVTGMSCLHGSLFWGSLEETL